MQEAFAQEEFDKSALFVQELMEEGREEGREEGAHQSLVSLTLLQLRYKLGELTKKSTEQIQALANAQLEDLGLALFRFESPDDLQQWLDAHAEKPLIH
jgi:predicted transposase YdaD